MPWFLTALRRGLEWAIDTGGVFDFLGHPSCLYVTDPEFRTVDLICELVKKAGRKAVLTDLGSVARQVRQEVGG